MSQKYAVQGRREKAAAGFTLVEAMMGAVLLLMVAGGILTGLLASYKIALQARYQERMMVALVTIADQFQNSARDNASDGSVKTIFCDTGGVATGTGLAWDSQKQCFIYPTATLPVPSADQIANPATLPSQYQGDATCLYVPLYTAQGAGGGAAPAKDLICLAKVTRNVETVIASGGVSAQQPDASKRQTSGYKQDQVMVKATFTASYFPPGVDSTTDANKKTLQIKVLRNLVHSDKDV